jgi:AcrR family transcriptional regulator
MGQIGQDTGRVNQKRRTRAAIVTAAAELLQQGKSPTVAEVADAAAVSRATAYRYFPTQEYLLSEATLNSVRGEVDQILEAAECSNAPEVRLDAVIQGLQERIVRQEAGFRALLRLSLEQPFEQKDGQEVRAPRRRGGRRIGWIEGALAPVWDRLDQQTKERLVGALSLCMGIDALVVLRDICGYSPQQAVEISRWAAHALLGAGLEEVTDGENMGED